MIKVKAFAVLLNRLGDAHLVWQGSDETKSPAHFHRLLGGHVEFGESSLDAVQREVREETMSELTEPRLLGVLENRFVYRGEPGHEVVFVYTGLLTPPEPVPAAGGWLQDNDSPIWAEWRPLTPDNQAPPLYPEGVQDLLSRLTR